MTEQSPNTSEETETETTEEIRYAQVKWSYQDIIIKKPDWTKQQAIDFLTKHEALLTEIQIKAASKTIDILLKSL